MLTKGVIRSLSLNRVTNIRMSSRPRRMSTSAIRNQDVPSTVHTVATCGIPKWDPPKPEEAATRKIELPSHLILPPCMPGGVRGEVQTCMSNDQGMYCQPCRKQYKFPSFSDNIDFVPPHDPTSCWWHSGMTCGEGMDEGPLQGMTRPCFKLED